VNCYNAQNKELLEERWSEENLSGRFRKYSYNEILERDKTNFDIFWLKDDNYVDLDNLSEPEILTQEIIDNMESALNSFREVVKSLAKI